MNERSMMQLTVNGQPRELAEGSTIADLLSELELDPRTLAVERNLDLVPRAKHAETQLAAGDRVEVVTLVGGG
jgi:sulfur carrier protein